LVRIFTRLALQDSFRRGRLEHDMRRSIRWFTEVANRNTYKGQIDVLIVGSLAGGAGCGSFIQVVLAVKQ
jgi:hypothetical protein